MKDLSPIEILEKLDIFYNNAWNRLILFTTILLAIVGLVIPLIINWWQNRNLKLREEALKTELNLFFERKVEELKQELSVSIESKFEEKIEDVKSYQEKIKAEMNGASFHLQANSIKTDIKEKLKNLIWAANGYKRGEDFMNLNIVLDMIISTLPKITKDDLSELEVEEASPNILIEEMASINTNDLFTSSIRKLKLALGKIKKEKKAT